MVNELVPVEALTRRTDRFHCAALKAALSAATCITRHTARREAGRNQHAGPARVPTYPFCASCAVGASVLVRVGALASVACVVCGLAVEGAKGRKPLCKAHRRAA